MDFNIFSTHQHLPCAAGVTAPPDPDPDRGRFSVNPPPSRLPRVQELIGATFGERVEVRGEV